MCVLFAFRINLPRKEKMCEPRYQELPKEKVPHVTAGGISAYVIAGSALGTTSPVFTKNPAEYVHFFMKPHQTLQQPIQKVSATGRRDATMACTERIV